MVIPPKPTPAYRRRYFPPQPELFQVGSSSYRIAKIFLICILVADVIDFTLLAIFGSFQYTYGHILEEIREVLLLRYIVAILILPPILVHGARKVFVRLGKRFSLQEGARLNIIIILPLVLLAELYYFHVTPPLEGWKGYSPMFPHFLAGPLIGFLCAIIFMTERSVNNISSWVLLLLTLNWILFQPLVNTLYFSNGHELQELMQQPPVIGIFTWAFSMWSLMFFNLFAAYGNEPSYLFFSGQLGILVLIIFLFVIPLRERYKGKISYPMAFTTMVTGIALLPFMHEWNLYIFD